MNTSVGGSGLRGGVRDQEDCLCASLEKIRHEVEKLVQYGPPMVTLGQLPFTPRAKKVLELALEEARVLDENACVGTEHLLLGCFREGDGVAAQVLANLGLKVEAVREEVLEFLGAKEDQRLPAQTLKERAIHEKIEEVIEIKKRLCALTAEIYGLLQGAIRIAIMFLE